ncbi:hypothetical protein I5Q25_08760 [Serratia ureilytica]|uniref:hypothetical protein n=1 Tax=Serratia ureilytica TaxID=300181 RepID=UPI0018D79533|nr:hypothetical protein [Serratia ureilytica]MBH2988171.1 hypothetical protein [Serratia ureilytica]
MSRANRDNLLDINKVIQSIKVQTPYFAFQQLWQEGESLVGSFTSEQPLLHEAGYITAGELGRHLAILGSCTAVALHNGPEGYYLATKAHFIRRSGKHTLPQRILYARAQVVDMNKRELKIFAQAWANGPIAELHCEYTILSPALFQRNFKNYACKKLSTSLDSPYQHPVSLYNLEHHGKELVAFAGPLSPHQCTGHFQNYPCWPVAIISQTAFQVTGELLNKVYGPGIRFYVNDTRLSAMKLIGADTALKFRVTLKENPPPLIQSDIAVYRDEEEIARLTNQLELILPIRP